MKRRKPRVSLSTRLFRRVLLLLALTGCAMGWVLYRAATHEMGHEADAQLVNASRLLYMMTQDNPAAGIVVSQGPVVDHTGDALFSEEESLAFQASYDSCMFVLFWNGQPIARSGWGAPVGLIPQKSGLHNFRADNASWRSFGVRGRDPRLMIVVAERDSMRRLSVGRVLGELAVPMALVLGAAMIVLWLTVRKGLSQVERLASRLNARSLSDLQPLPPQDWPRDLSPLVVALNKLFARLEGAYELEQAFTDDVAHELRTPLAAIRAQAQLLRKIARAEYSEAVDGLIARVDRVNDLISGMLMLARLNATSVSSQSIDVHALVAEVVADEMLSLPADAMEFTVMPDHVVRWNCDGSLLLIALSAVITNATRHAREGGHVDIAITRGADRLVITIGDRGQGVPACERERLLRRFESGLAETSGSGLGLSIASKAMGLLGGTIQLDERPGGPGLLVILKLPLNEG